MMFFKKSKDKMCGRRRDRKATEFDLLRAASQLFAEKGYENTRTLDIAKAAGANEALILRYFGGKEGLLTAIFKDENFLQMMMQSKLNMCKEDELNAVFTHKRTTNVFQSLFLDFFKASGANMDMREPFMRIASSRALVDKEMATVIQSKMIVSQIDYLKEKLSVFLSEHKKKMKPAEIEAMAILISSVNYSMNFMLDRVYQIDREKIDASLDLLSKALEAYIAD